jgi:hypothetical protein
MFSILTYRQNNVVKRTRQLDIVFVPDQPLRPFGEGTPT